MERRNLRAKNYVRNNSSGGEEVEIVNALVR